ncbi:formate/nitrite transporter protein [Sesbania bispinosa]|nr:formate/nitrite transporter protein [Sesbania bispinosa]
MQQNQRVSRAAGPVRSSQTFLSSAAGPEQGAAHAEPNEPGVEKARSNRVDPHRVDGNSTGL